MSHPDYFIIKDDWMSKPTYYRDKAYPSRWFQYAIIRAADKSTVFRTQKEELAKEILFNLRVPR